MQTSLVMATPPPEVGNGSSVRYFTDWVVDTVSQYVSPQQDLVITTTLDLGVQHLVEEKAKEVMAASGKKWHAEQIALVSMSPDGGVQALLGGTDYTLTKFNRATQALRQPGSVFKFFTFLTALESGMTADSMVSDIPPVIGTWKPKNYRYTPQGQVSLEEAFAKSVNASAVRLAMQMGVKRVIGMARTLGITTKIPPNLSIALGTGEVTLMELTGASASVANGGLRVYPHGILFIKNKAGRLLYRWEGQKETVLQPTTVENMRRLMGAVMKTGTGRSAAIGRPALGKTGTTQDYRDVWFVGATPELITGIWAGRDSYKPMTRMPGGAPPLHLWKAVMEALLAGKPVVPFPVVSSPLVSSPGVSSSGVSPSSPNGIPGDVAGMTFRGNEQSPSLPSPANTWTDKVPAPLSLDALLEKAGG